MNKEFEKKIVVELTENMINCSPEKLLEICYERNRILKEENNKLNNKIIVLKNQISQQNEPQNEFYKTINKTIERKLNRRKKVKSFFRKENK